MFAEPGSGGGYVRYTGGGDPDDVEVVPFVGDGDFRSPECQSLLREADIVASNPPFSLFREYIRWMLGFGKKILTIGPIPALGYKDISARLLSRDLWNGPFPLLKWFENPRAPSERAHVSACWYTNLEHGCAPRGVDCVKLYTPEEYPKYDNCDAIDVSVTAHIPGDYDGVMGVPLTYILLHDPGIYDLIARISPRLQGENLFHRWLIRRRVPGRPLPRLDDLMRPGGRDDLDTKTIDWVDSLGGIVTPGGNFAAQGERSGHKPVHIQSERHYQRRRHRDNDHGRRRNR